MVSYLGYSLFGAGVITFLIAWLNKLRKSLPLMFAATMMVMGDLAILQFLGTETHTY